MSPEQIENWLRQFEGVAKVKESPAPKPYRAPSKPYARLSGATIAKMRHMRREGFTITEIARAGKCTWRTAWAQTKGFAK